MQIEVRLYATLRDFAPPEALHGVYAATLRTGATVQEILDSLAIPTKKVHMIMRNGAGVTPEEVLQENDRLGLFPPIGGG